MNDVSKPTTSIETVVYTAHAHTTGGRSGGTGRSSDGELEVKLSTPGAGQPGTNPEQLFAIGYSACFLSAIKAVAAARKIRLSDESSIDAEVVLGKTSVGQYQLAVTLKANLPGIEPGIRQELLDGAHQTCPYSRATRGEISVDLISA